MEIYQPHVLEGFEWVMPVAEADLELMKLRPTEALIGDWAPVEVEFVHEDDGHRSRRSDFPWFGSHTR